MLELNHRLSEQSTPDCLSKMTKPAYSVGMSNEKARTDLAAEIHAGLNALKERKGTTAKAVGDEIGLSEQAVSRWRRTGKIDRHHLAKLSEILWREIKFDLQGQRANLSKKMTVDTVPLLSWDFITLKGIQKLANFGEKSEHVTVPTGQYSRHAFAATVENDSMVAPQGGYSFPPGCQIIVEPDAEPKNGDFVVAELADGDITFKELVIDGNRRHLKPLNPRYPLIDGTDTQIIGVVYQALINTRRP